MIEIKTETPRFEDTEVKYKDKTFTIQPLYKLDGNIVKGCQLNDTIVDFYTHWMFHERFTNEHKHHYELFGSYFYTHLQARIAQIKEPLRKSTLAEFYGKLFRKPNTTIFQKQVLILPIFLKSNRHWALALIHNPAGALLKTEPAACHVDNNNNRRTSGLDVKTDYAVPEDECRILIMDSLIKHTKFRHILRRQHAIIADTLRLWLRMEAAIYDRELLGSRIRSVTCENLPTQRNSVDCGIFMIAFAEYFTYWNTEWMDYATGDLERLEIDESLADDLLTLTARHRLESFIQHASVNPN